ncbi:glucose-1-phosphate adenylyltransferase [Vibrio mediterranei]|jgi:glucose-1-phosphate adenylyltransferase|uniref:Glucose-1-phosphate adenylyltransferase n=1 Tax=Vibrio mediterranei TaxID=689 RepID=A0ABX5DEP7_9VIBR|nr:glucose-1-phosphate adenylyltransferase [Vibrio mediterranei]MCG9659755.1 glucose-1-phosphate adenylyltransferase [Vibrio mediterranei]PCD89520.1 glucose-1-phosphate adenylyltransferase [Vibrio mediterranei]PRQ68119.1 glucose-1-phosphate adenylyltransferase [Vibrio mediterranei]PTC04803.1 glucose-1-phosphate adenylyltransferase [Vibrio mediterranei]SBO11177.1 Glucose-1-phosphate adenylyltransferase [Vibrio mediterranei]
MPKENQYSHISSNARLRNTTAMILAGGKGTRLKELTSTIAKPAVSFGGKFKIIDFALSNCINSGIRKVGVLTQYMAQDLISHIQSGWQSSYSALGEGVHIIPAQQRVGENWYRGTADAIYQNLDLIKRHDQTERILILGGDHIYKMDYSRMINFHVESGADVTVACIQKPIEQASEFGVMGLNDEGDIINFVEKPTNPTPMPNDDSKALISMGIYIFNVDVLDAELRQALTCPDYKHDFGHNIIPSLIGRSNLKGYVFTERGHPGANGYWRDVGHVDEYYAATMDLLAPTPELDIYDKSWPIMTNQVQRPGAKFLFNDPNRRGYAVDSVVCAGAIISGAQVTHTLVSSDVRIDDFTEITDSILLPSASVGQNCKLKKVIVGENCHIPNSMEIGFDVELDKQRFTVTDEGIVLVTQDMFPLKEDSPLVSEGEKNAQTA